ncbi:MAG TPA: serine hydrolase domain-containing protein [Bacteroidales bacterium]|nr:serine hydrolase domain-containing protein [Bacteroidales bacterium]
MNLKIIIGLVLFFFLFLGEIAMTFSFKHESNRNIPTSEVTPLSFKLTNELSSNEVAIPIDSIFNDFLSRMQIKGASVAIAKNGRLIFAKGFGFADEEDSIKAEPKNLFRIASVSKLITAITVMKLNEEGRIDLDDKVFGPNGILNDSIFLHYTDSHVEDITIRDLLVHTGGWNGKKSDPIFNSLYIARKMKIDPPARLDDIIRYQLGEKLHYNPGTKYSYSNFGYTLLGKIIEVTTGMSYEDYVQFAILHPLGIYDMHIGRSFFDERFPNEVKYYELGKPDKCYAYDGSGKLVPIAYGGNNIELLGAAGGWVASASELLKLIISIDGFESKADILSEESIEMMTPSKKNKGNTIGWRGTDGYGTWWRTGTLAGASALIMRHQNEIDWVVLLNTSTKNRSRIHNEISRTMFKALRSVKEWPDFDLFNYAALSSENHPDKQ